MKTILAIIALIITALAAYFTHLWWSLSNLFAGTLDQTNEYIIAILGVVAPPIGVIHGFYLWFT